MGAGGVGTDFLRLTGAAFFTAAFLATAFLPAAFFTVFAAAFFGAAFFTAFFTGLFLTAALRVAFFATTLRAEVLVAGFFAAFAAEGFFVTTLFAVFFAAAFAIMIGPSRLIPSRETSSVRRRCNADVNFAFFLRASERAAEQRVPSGGLSNKHAHVAINSLRAMARHGPAQGVRSESSAARAMASWVSVQQTGVSATTMFSTGLRDSGDRRLVDLAAMRAPRAARS